MPVEIPALPGSEPVQEQQPAAVPHNFEARVDGLKGKALEHWQLTGDIDAAEKLGTPNSDEPAESSPAPKPGAPVKEEAQTEPESGTGEAQPKTRQDRDWVNLRKKAAQQERDLIAAHAKLELYERQNADSGKSAPAATKDEAKTGLEKPKRPRLVDFDDVEAYESAMDSYEEAKDRYQDDRQRQHLTQESAVQTMRTWGDQVEAAKSKFNDFEAIAFNPDVPASFASIPRLQSRKDGAEIAYFLGKNVEVAARIAEMTEIPGIQTPEDYAALVKKAQTDPRSAAMLARAEALVDAEFDRIAKSLGKPAADPKPRPRVPLKPTSEVSVVPRGAPVSDELQHAIETGNQEAYESIMNKRDVERRKSGG